MPLPTPSRSGFKFKGWTDSQSNPVTDSTVINTADDYSTLNAQWAKVEETVTHTGSNSLFLNNGNAAGNMTEYLKGSSIKDFSNQLFSPSNRSIKVTHAIISASVSGTSGPYDMQIAYEQVTSRNSTTGFPSAVEYKSDTQSCRAGETTTYEIGGLYAEGQQIDVGRLVIGFNSSPINGTLQYNTTSVSVTWYFE